MTITLGITENNITLLQVENFISISIEQAHFPYDWYVDAINGDDDNDGTYLSPYATIAKLLTVWTAGQSVGLAKGSTWREELFLPGVGSGVYAYGSGADPILDASDIIAKGSITKTVGQTNVYQFTVTLPNVPSQPAFPQLWGDDAYFTRQTSIANVDANANTCYWTGTTGSVTCYFHAVGSTDPTTNATVYTYAARLTALYSAPSHTGTSATGCAISGIRTQKNLSQNGSFVAADGATILNVSCYYGSKHNAYVGENVTWTGGTIQDAYFNSAATMIVANKDVPTGGTVTYGGLTLKLTSASPVPANILPMNSHYNTSGAFGTITVADCYFEGFTGSGQSFAFNNTPTIVMTNPTFLNCQRGVAGPIDPTATFTITGMTWTSNCAGDVRAIDWNGTLAQLSLSNSTFTLDVASSTGLIFITGAPTVSITNNTFKSNITTGSRIAVYIQASTANVTLTGNTFNTGSGHWTYHYAFTANSSGITWTSDKNTFKATSNAWSIFGTVYVALATYQAGTGKDANSTSS